MSNSVFIYTLSNPITIKDAAEAYNMKTSTLGEQLRGANKNKTDLKFI